jgi:hypothetical protein
LGGVGVAVEAYIPVGELVTGGVKVIYYRGIGVFCVFFGWGIYSLYRVYMGFI